VWGEIECVFLVKEEEEEEEEKMQSWITLFTFRMVGGVREREKREREREGFYALKQMAMQWGSPPFVPIFSLGLIWDKVE